MSKVANSIRRGLEQAVAYTRGQADTSRYRVHVPEKIDVRAVRRRARNGPGEGGCGENRG